MRESVRFLPGRVATVAALVIGVSLVLAAADVAASRLWGASGHAGAAVLTSVVAGLILGGLFGPRRAPARVAAPRRSARR